MTTTTTAYREWFVCWAGDPTNEESLLDNDHASDVDCDWGWMCNHEGCLTRVDEQPCPTHAPTAVPGLRLVECQSEPRHWLFAHDRDDYGHGCPWCWYEQAAAELKPLQEAAVRRAHRWCWLLNPVKRLAGRLRLVRITGYSGWAGACWHVTARWWWSR